VFSLAVGAVIVAQTLYSIVKDHMRELATLRAMGGTRRELLSFIGWQSSTLASLPLLEPWRGVRRSGSNAWHIVDRSRGSRDNTYTALCGKRFTGIGWSVLAGEIRDPRCLLCEAEYKQAIRGAGGVTAPLRKYPSETRTVTFDFAPTLAAGETLQGLPTATADDPALVVSHVVLGDTSVTCKVAGGALGASYRVVAHAATTAGNELEVVRRVDRLGPDRCERARRRRDLGVMASCLRTGRLQDSTLELMQPFDLSGGDR
jgi:hypothetical protein